MAPFVSPTLDGLLQVIWVFVPMLVLTFVLHRVARNIPAIHGLAPDWKSWTSDKFPMGVTLAATLVFLLGWAVYAG